MNEEPLLTEAWRDIIALGSLAVTLVGFGLAYWQLRKTKTAALAAQEAAERSVDESRRQFQSYILACSMRYLAEAKLLASRNQWPEASTRLGDLADQMVQLADFDEDWLPLLSEVRDWAGKIDDPTKKPRMRSKFVATLQRVQQKVDSHHGPFKSVGR